MTREVVHELIKAQMKEPPWQGGKPLELQGVCLRGENLRGSIFMGAGLQGADLRDANLQGAQLNGADLRGTDLHGADLGRANLRGAKLDNTCWPLWRGGLNVCVDKDQAMQIAYIFCRLVCGDPEFLAARNAILGFANQHRWAEEYGALRPTDKSGRWYQ